MQLSATHAIARRVPTSLFVGHSVRKLHFSGIGFWTLWDLILFSIRFVKSLGFVISMRNTIYKIFEIYEILRFMKSIKILNWSIYAAAIFHCWLCQLYSYSLDKFQDIHGNHVRTQLLNVIEATWGFLSNCSKGPFYKKRIWEFKEGHRSNIGHFGQSDICKVSGCCIYACIRQRHLNKTQIKEKSLYLL